MRARLPYAIFLCFLGSILLVESACGRTTSSSQGSNPPVPPTIQSPTPTPMPTATPTLQPLVQDSLTNVQTVVPIGTSACGSHSDGLHVSGRCDYAPRPFGNVTITVQAQITQGGDRGYCGIGIRRSVNEDNIYHLVITAKGTWWTGATDEIPSSAIKQGAGVTNQLQLRMVGSSHFDFYVNGTKITSMDNPTLSNGEIFFIGWNEAVFTDLLITTDQ